MGGDGGICVAARFICRQLSRGRAQLRIEDAFMKFALIAILLIFPAAYAKAPASNMQAVPGREFRIRINQAVSFDRGRLKIAFQGVPQDSRCPEGVNCVWSGNA
jgi:hypothetical protein